MSGAANSIHRRKSMRVAGRGLEQADGDEVGRASDRREQAADRRGVGDAQEQPDAEAPRASVEATGVAVRPSRRLAHHSQRHRQHHRGGRGVAHPSRDRHGQNADAEPRAAGTLADRGHREESFGEPAIESVVRDRRSEDEAAQEEEDGRAAERRERLLCGRNARDHRERRPHHRGDGERDRLGDPPHHDQHHDRGEAMRFGRERRHRREPCQCERERSEEEARCAPAELEALLRGGQCPVERLGHLTPADRSPWARAARSSRSG